MKSGVSTSDSKVGNFLVIAEAHSYFFVARRRPSIQNNFPFLLIDNNKIYSLVVDYSFLAVSFLVLFSQEAQ